MLLVPARLIAPVGSEVVLLSGLCGVDGYFITQETIEWMLTPDSVGHIVEVGDVGNKLTRSLRSETLGKIGIDYAVARTTHHPKLLTRGTISPLDDVLVRKGQSWLTISSPTEGTSFVTALAPEGAGWRERRQTATIYWVDAQWVFPSPAIAPAGQPQQLVTTLTRQTDSQPIAGWIVRYEVVSGAPATFGNTNQPVVEVMTDASGRAIADLVPQSPAPGATQVHIQIIRPEENGSPRVVVGDGWTTVTWSAPGLAVNVTGPEIASAGSVAVYEIQVSNPGDLATRGVVVAQQLPPGLTFVGSNPPGQILGDRVHWNIGDLGPKSVATIVVETRAEGGGDVRYCVRAESTDGLSDEKCAATRIFRQALAVQMRGPETAVVGEAVTYLIEVTNTGDQALTNVLLSDTFAVGLEHSERQLSPVEFLLGDMTVGETMTKELTFIVRGPGQLCHQLQVTAAGGHFASAEACLIATAPAVQPAPVQPAPAQPAPAGTPDQYDLQVTMKKVGPPRAQVGTLADYQIDIVNNSDLPLNNVQVSATIDPALEPKLVTPGYIEEAARQGQLVWPIAQLPARSTATLRISTMPQSATAAATNKVTVTSLEGVTGSGSVVTQISEPTPPPADVPAQPAGAMTISISETSDPIRVGQTTKYLIAVTNRRNTDDRNMQLQITLPEGLQFVRINAAQPRITPDGRTITLVEQAVRIEEKLEYELEVEARQAGTHVVQAQVQSFLTAIPQSAQEDTTVFGN